MGVYTSDTLRRVYGNPPTIIKFNVARGISAMMFLFSVVKK